MNAVRVCVQIWRFSFETATHNKLNIRMKSAFSRNFKTKSDEPAARIYKQRATTVSTTRQTCISQANRSKHRTCIERFQLFQIRRSE